MAEKRPPIDEKPDDETSLEKEIEQMDKDKLEYVAKRDELSKKLALFREELDKTHEKIKKQRIENQAAINILQRQARSDPRNKDLHLLLEKAKEDKNFLILASAEIVSVKGDLKKEMNRLQSSKDFNVPLDINAITVARVKPLPSERHNRRQEQTTEAVKDGQKNARNGRQTGVSLGRKIQGLRRTMPEHMAATRSAGRGNRERT